MICIKPVCKYLITNNNKRKYYLRMEFGQAQKILIGGRSMAGGRHMY